MAHLLPRTGVEARPGFIRSAWRGEESLALAYWFYGVIVGNLIGIAIERLPSNTPTLVVWAAVFGSIPYFVWVNVAIWRCAANSTTIWALLARASVVFVIGRFLWVVGEIATT